MAEFPTTYKSRSFVHGEGPNSERVVRMVLEDGTVLGPDAEPISGPGFEKKKAAAAKPAPKKVGLRKAAMAAARMESADAGEEEV